MTDTVPDGPTDPKLTVVGEDDEENTTFVPRPGYVVPPMPSTPPPPVPAAPAGPEPAGGRIYAAGERSYSPAPDAELEPDPEPDRGAASRGRTTVADQVVEQVVEKIVNVAADQVAGARGVHTDPAGEPAAPVSVQLDGDRAVVDITLRVEFGHPLHEVVENVRRAVIGEIERLLGLTVTDVNILVAEVVFDPAS